MASKQQIPVLAGKIVSNQHAFEPLPDKDAQWAIENPEEAIALAVSAIIARSKPQKILLDYLNWTKVYNALGMEEEFASVLKSMSPRAFDAKFWDIPVVKGITCNKVIKALRNLDVACYLYVDNLDKDVTKNDRDPNRDGSYQVRFLKTVEADPKLANKSANDLESEQVKGITLLERLLLELAYFMATGNHLDVDNVTLCSGSRDSGGRVPRVDWDRGYRKVYVRWFGPSDSYSGIRARAVVS